MHHSWESFLLPFKWPSENTENWVFAPHELWISLLQWFRTKQNRSLYNVRSQPFTSTCTHTHRIWTEILISKWKDKRTREKHSKQIEFMCLCRAFHSSFVPQSMGNYCASVWEKRHGEDLEKKQVQNREIKPCVSAVQSRANIKGLSPSSAPAEQAGVCALIRLESCHIIHSLWNVR